jgi:pSer/pThr/pTyr-binding forkhead associated (FHA) protein
MTPVMSNGLLLVIPGIDPARWAYSLGEGRHTVGRDATCQIRLAHPTVSHRHAEIRREGESLRVRDLGSRNGTFIDNLPIQDAPLAVGQCIGMGKVKLEVTDFRDKEHGEHAHTLPTQASDIAPLAGNSGLSSAQVRVLDLLFQGLSEKKIAQRLELSTHTVHAHMKSIYKNLGVHSHTELMSFFLSGRGR